jgi:superfamily II DNA or RNA helicase
MAYLLEDNIKNINEDILKRKEFYKYKKKEPEKKSNINIIPRFFIEKMIRDGNYLQLSSYQNFTKNYINPHTPYSRLMLKWETGVGKTIGGLSIAMNFIQYYQQENMQGVTTIGSIFVIGFSSIQFKSELLRFPEFGFITRDELSKLKSLRKRAYSGNRIDIEHLQEFLMHIRKRFSNRENNGFFEFIGYKKLSNMIFIKQDPLVNISNLDENGIADAIKNNKIKLNTPLLETFKNSLIICDEIHNTYNSLEKNNWGVALQYVLNYHPSIRAVFLSATPINNNPTEIIDLLNLLLPITFYPNKLEKTDFFDNDKQLKNNAIDKIAELCKGRFSYLRDNNPKYFPTKKFIGEDIANAPYIKFIRCPMSEFHYNTYKKVYTGSLPPESQYLVDFAVPNPKDSKIGLYQTSTIKSELKYASQEWKDKNKINFKKDRIIGDILQLNNLSKISTKFTEMLKTVTKNIKNAHGKMFIYHNIIHMSGVLFIQEILLQNNIIGEFDTSTANTLCAICGEFRKTHDNIQMGGESLCPVQKGNFIIKHNLNNGYFEVYLDADCIPILEYKIYDDILLIPASFINYKKKPCDVCRVIQSLTKKNKVIIESSPLNHDLKKIIKKLKFYILTSANDGNLIYHTNTQFKMGSSDKKKLVSNFQKRSKLVSNFQKRSKLVSNFQKSGGSVQKNKHMFTPVRFIAVHGNIDKNSMYNSIEKYNSPDNSDGNRIMILIGGKIIKEAFDIKSVREMLIMGRPDNIPTLIQILGRAVRKGSHTLLPPDQRNVNIRIFTSCLPIKKNNSYEKSYEEDKYVEKLKHYQIIQNIEKTIHENAVDAVINQDIIWTESEKKFSKSHKSLGSLYFEPNTSKKNNKQFTLSELNLETFNAFYSDAEIHQLIIIIKRLFIEKSSVWLYKDLLYAVRNCNKYFNVEFNTVLINEELFIIALTKLLYVLDTNYIEPFVNDKHKISRVIDKLFDTSDKIIILPGNQYSIITQMGLYYILFPVDANSNNPIKDIELPYRITTEKKSTTVDIKQFLESGQPLIDYSNKRDRFFTKWNNVAIEKLELAVCDFGTDFHIEFVEECIKYVFEVWLDSKVKKSFMHSFYFKMLNYYDLRNLVIWSHTIKSFMYKKYSQFLIPVDSKIKSNRLKLENIKSKEHSSSGLINLLKSSINKSDIRWISSGLKERFENNIEQSLKLFDGNYKKKTPKKKISADLIPVGHFLNYIPKFYHPENGWFESPEYLDSNEQFVENNVIIGYDERSKTGIHIRFKVRNPIQNIKQFKDTRLIEKGSVCSFRSKIFLKDIANKLGIKYKGKINVDTLCTDIRTKLIYLEIKERVAKSKKKWFYFIYENRPEIITDEKK